MLEPLPGGGGGGGYVYLLSGTCNVYDKMFNLASYMTEE